MPPPMSFRLGAVMGDHQVKETVEGSKQLSVLSLGDRVVDVAADRGSDVTFRDFVQHPGNDFQRGSPRQPDDPAV